MNFKEPCLTLALGVCFCASLGYAAEPCVSQLEKTVRARTSPFRSDAGGRNVPGVATSQFPTFNQIGLIDRPLVVEPELVQMLQDILTVYGYRFTWGESDSTAVAEIVQALYEGKSYEYMELCAQRETTRTWIVRRVSNEDGSSRSDTNPYYLMLLRRGVKLKDTLETFPADEKYARIFFQLSGHHRSDIDTTAVALGTFLQGRSDSEAANLQRELERTSREYADALRALLSSHSDPEANRRRLHDALSALAKTYRNIASYACTHGA